MKHMSPQPPSPNWHAPWYSWRASLRATVAGALAGVLLLTAIAAWNAGGINGETVFFMLSIALPTALVVAAPIGFIILPLARLVLDRMEAYTTGRLMLVGAASGFVLPLAAAWRVRARFVTESWALTVIFIVAATAAGAIGALAFHRRMAQGRS